MPTFGSLLTTTKARAQLTTDSSYDVYLQSYLNLGQADVITRFLWDFMRVDETVTTVAAQSAYPLAANEIVYDMRNTTSVIRMKYMRDVDLDMYDVAQVVTAPPVAYRMEGQYKPSAAVASVPQVMVYPIPDGVYTLALKAYRYLPDMVSTTDISGIPEPFHELMIHYALNAFFSSRGDPRAQEQFDKYENKLMSMVEQLGGIPTDQIDVVRSLEDMGNAGFIRFPSAFGNEANDI